MTKKIIQDKISLDGMTLFNDTIDNIIKSLECIKNNNSIFIDRQTHKIEKVISIEVDQYYDNIDFYVVVERYETDSEYKSRLKKEEKSKKAKEAALKRKLSKEKKELQIIQKFAEKYGITNEAAEKIINDLNAEQGEY